MTWLAVFWDALAAWLAYRQRHRDPWWDEQLAASRPPWERP